MDTTWATTLLTANLLSHAVLLTGAVWCIAFPERRIYPLSDKTAWYYLMWSLFNFIFASNLVFVVVDWNNGIWTSPLRFCVAVPTILAGFAFLLWGIATLGVKNTSGRRDGFVATGPYRVSRNPQYVGDFFIFAGMSIFANSNVVLVTNLLTALVFILAPLAEETWLEEQYGETYNSYRLAAPRFL